MTGLAPLSRVLAKQLPTQQQADLFPSAPPRQVYRQLRGREDETVVVEMVLKQRSGRGLNLGCSLQLCTEVGCEVRDKPCLWTAHTHKQVESRAAQVLVGLRALVSQRGSSTMARLRTALTWSLVPQRAG